MTLILQNTISRFNFFRIESFDSWVCEPRKKKICWVPQQGTEKSIFRVIFRIGFDIMTTMILQNTISTFNYFLIQINDSLVCYFGELQKKNLLYVAARKSVTFRSGFEIMTTIILQNTISRFKLFWF